MQNFRQERIRQILLEEINSMIVLKKISDPRVSSSISAVHAKISKDANFATIYMSSFGKATTLNNSVKALNHAKGFIQLEIHKRHKWKYTPKLLFKASDGLQRGQRVLDNLAALFSTNSTSADGKAQRDSQNLPAIKSETLPRELSTELPVMAPAQLSEQSALQKAEASPLKKLSSSITPAPRSKT